MFVQSGESPRSSIDYIEAPRPSIIPIMDNTRSSMCSTENASVSSYLIILRMYSYYYHKTLLIVRGIQSSSS